MMELYVITVISKYVSVAYMKWIITTILDYLDEKLDFVPIVTVRFTVMDEKYHQK